MVSFNVLFSLASLAVLCSAYSPHQGYNKHYPRPYNTTSTADPSSYPVGTGHLGGETHHIEYAKPSATVAPTFKHTTTTCVEETETKTYTYTLGNGHAVTTCVTKTHLVTKTISAEATEPPVYHDMAHSYTSTTTSTITEVVTLTRQRPSSVAYVAPTPPTAPPASIGAEGKEQSYCTPVTVYVPAETVYVTVPQTVTVTAPASGYPTLGAEQHTHTPPPPPPPAYTSKPVVHHPYQNSTAHFTSTRYVTVVPYQ